MFNTNHTAKTSGFSLILRYVNNEILQEILPKINIHLMGEGFDVSNNL